ncbi:MAG TPA: hypothetical protein VFV04_00310 [Burkholderiales bacterium]|nr:hypothetical protein [Burkholderiales bacterium]
MPGFVALRAAIARVVIVALLLPAAFGLSGAGPEWMLGINVAGYESARHAAHDHHDGSADRGKDYSNIPGSPGHPADHNCNPCQVLKYLASYLPQLPLFLPASAPNAVPLIERGAPQRAGHIASLPPSRAPPQSAA